LPPRSNPRSADWETALAPRRAAVAALGQVLDRARPLEDGLERAVAREGLASRERAFCRALATTTLRRLGGLEHILARFVPRRLPRKAATARNALRLGLAQLLFMKVADHAAVDTSVELVAEARRPADRALKNLVNAVLRRALREREALQSELERDPALFLPETLTARWRRMYGAATRDAIVRACLSEPPLDVTVKDPQDRAAWARRLGADLLPTGSLRLKHAGAVEELSGFSDGAFWIQDAAAALPARLLAGSGAVADLCAAPGGKTLQLAAQGGGPVTALDRSESRCARLRDNLARTGLSAEVVAADLLAWQPEGAFSRVLLDAPCTATGTLRRHPDAAWTREAADLASLTEIQRRLLDRAIQLLAPGGRLVYCVCSLEPEEGLDQVEAALAHHAGLTRAPIAAAEVPGLTEAITPQGDLRTLPCHWADAGGMDGFYIARLARGD